MTVTVKPLNGNQWLLCIAFAIALLPVDEVSKLFIRARRGHGKREAKPVAVAGPTTA